MATELTQQNSVLGSGCLSILLAILLRWCVALHSYSGEKTPPMFGDYEAQRHWMEITYNLPIRDWYRNTEDNNLTYWGLDYPPLTAYHSYVYGVIASLVVPDSVKLGTSHGHETYHHKLFMRYSVLTADLLIFVPAVYCYFKSRFRSARRAADEAAVADASLFLTLTYPGLLLVDYGHFQYNCVSLGFTVAAVAALTTRYFKMAAVLFCLAVNYKQMELYHSLPFFVFFLGRYVLTCRKQGLLAGLRFILPIAICVLTVFALLWSPFLGSPPLFEDAIRVLSRVFPVDRGIYEDKVSSVWCVLNVFYKLRTNVSNETMLKVCLAVTLISVLPSLAHLLLNPSVEKFKFSLIICSLCFFLFSYHVHEKSILLAAVPVCLDLSRQPIASFWFLFLSTFSMLPLFVKDGLFVPFVALSIFYYLSFTSTNTFTFTSTSTSVNYGQINTLLNVSLLGCTVLTVLTKFCPPPNPYPHFWSLLISLYSFAHFISFLFYYYMQQLAFKFKKKKY